MYTKVQRCKGASHIVTDKLQQPLPTQPQPHTTPAQHEQNQNASAIGSTCDMSITTPAELGENGEASHEDGRERTDTMRRIADAEKPHTEELTRLKPMPKSSPALADTDQVDAVGNIS